jgi:hypothetical protein
VALLEVQEQQTLEVVEVEEQKVDTGANGGSGILYTSIFWFTKRNWWNSCFLWWLHLSYIYINRNLYRINYGTFCKIRSRKYS